MRDSNLNCGIARERETERKLASPNTRPAVRRTKGLSNYREKLSSGGPAHPLPEAGGRGKGKGANSAPVTAPLPNCKQASSF